MGRGRTLCCALLATVVGVQAMAQDQKLVSGIDVENLSKTVSPGKDFYEYANEVWLSKTQIPDDQSNYGSFTILDDATKAAIRSIIEDAAKDTKGSGPKKQIGDLYRSVTDVETRNKKGIQPLNGVLSQIQSIKTKKDWAKVSGELSRIGVGNMIGIGVEQDARKSDEMAVYYGQSGTSLPDRDFYIKDDPRYKEILGAFQVYVADMLKFTGHPDPQAAAVKIVALETAFAKAQWTKVELRDPVKTYNKKEYKEAASLLSSFDLETHTKAMGLKPEGFVVVGTPSFFQAANKIFDETPIDTLKDFLTFSAIDTYARTLSEEIQTRHFQFHATVLSGITEQKPLWRRGVETCNAILGMPVGQLYVEKHFAPEAKKRMEELVANLMVAFKERINKLDWMSTGTKEQALNKLSKFTAKIGYPDKWKDYSSVVIKADDYTGNAIRLAEFEHNYQLAKIGKPIDRTEWLMPPQTINAYYNPLKNEIVFPAGILQPPFFNLKADDAVNYGGIGAVIGHEISHGFDDSGSQFNGDGNLQVWWNDKDQEEFVARSEKLVANYSEFRPFEDMAVNGKFTLGENIGDLGGVAVAYHAYRLSLGGKEAPVLDGFTGDQRFFLGYAQIWRRKYREKELRNRLMNDPHSPSHYRVIGIVPNMDAFYDAFQIKPTDDMYIAPENRVRIW